MLALFIIGLVLGLYIGYKIGRKVSGYAIGGDLVNGLIDKLKKLACPAKLDA